MEQHDDRSMTVIKGIILPHALLVAMLERILPGNGKAVAGKSPGMSSTPDMARSTMAFHQP